MDVIRAATPPLDQCVILVGGMGTRLGSLTEKIPKPLLPIGEEPFLSTLIDEAERFGFKRVLLLAGHLGGAVREFVDHARARQRFGIALDVVFEPSPLGTGGALYHARDHLDARFLLLNGDSWFDFNWLDLGSLDALNDDRILGALSLRWLPDANRFGVVTITDERVSSFAERGDVGGGYVNGGVYVLKRTICGEIASDGSLEANVLPRLATEGRLAGRAYHGFFLDIGVPTDFARSQKEIPAQRHKPAAFFDRDGVLNVDKGYTYRSEDLIWNPGAKEAIKRLNDGGYYVFVVTNQAGIAKGYYDEEAVSLFHATMQRELRAMGGHVDDWRYCPYHPDGTVEAYRREHAWRKPQPGMITDLFSVWPVDSTLSFLIGDKPSDLEAARNGGIAGILYDGPNLDVLVSGLLEANFENVRDAAQTVDSAT